MKVGAACGLGILLLLGWRSVRAAESIEVGGKLPSSRGVVIWWALSSAAKIQPQTALPANYSSTVEHYEYLTILRHKLDQRRASLPEEKVREYETLLQVPDSITRSMTEFTLDGRPIELRRDQIARAIESL